MEPDLHLKKYLEVKRKLHRKLADIERKLDHIIYRLREADPRIVKPQDDVDGIESELFASEISE